MVPLTGPWDTWGKTWWAVVVCVGRSSDGALLGSMCLRRSSKGLIVLADFGCEDVVEISKKNRRRSELGLYRDSEQKMFNTFLFTKVVFQSLFQGSLYIIV